MEEKELLTTLSYSISISQYDKAFSAFQRKYVFPKNIAMSIIFAVVIGLYANSVYHDPNYTLGWILMAVCLGFIFIIWYNTFRIKNTLINTIKEIEDDKYTTSIYDDSLVIKTEVAETGENEDTVEIQPKTISYILDNPEVMELDDMFIIYLKKQMFYVIPKTGLSEDQISILRKCFEEKLDNKFYKLKV